MNRVILIGNLARDPDVRTTGSGIAVTTFPLAVNRMYKGQDSKQIADYFTVVTWKQLAEICGKYLVKGNKVAVSGELHTRSYDAKDGTKRYVTEVVAASVEFLTPKGMGAFAPAHVPDASDFQEIDDENLPF